MIAPGFFGKLPAAGDFVTRRLPAPFVRAWDRFAARHLVPRLAAPWPAGGLRFRLALGDLAAIAGVALPSADRAGRAFPLTLAAPGVPLHGWLDALAAEGAAAAAGALDADALDARLLALPVPAAGISPPGLLLWTGEGVPRPAAPAAPGAVLDALLAPAEAG